jgi:curved DNA-binding protein CbpA
MCLTHYEVLGVTEEATTETIKEIYKKLVLVYHPDKCGPNISTEKFQKIQLAYEILSNNTRRAEYDRSIICQPIRATVPLSLKDYMFGVRKDVKIKCYSYENFETKLKEKSKT